ncbi:FKBP-type peptidyl-prolyl cis-trans isomerase FklB [Rhabdobacter roseus]|uniref:Peptidyl-prolyl cis-trans isomerase n=1 Tax=Rhabdobacter roseus TaxID=1655419 RepID=A0A840TPR3_9BACT|nr:FKBP-type peptidyl-prolyl cis-trans isomerase [Rhabdobacter roseus]MBB5285334.1 FKBP-type peptidyl-prolyl cis-trans isomerase FklB [Rhabdobacter roseus]
MATLSVAQTSKTSPKPASTAKPATQAEKPAASTVAPVLKTQLDSVAYSIGISVAGSLKGQGLAEINTELLMKAINETLKGGTTLLTAEQANQCIGEYFQEQSSRVGRENKEKGEKFLAQNKTRTGVQTTQSGLQYEVIKMGEGPKPSETDRIKAHYHGTLVDGTVFDSSVERGEPVEFPVNGVIPGWQEALQLMPVGSKWKLYLPSQIAYGERAAGPAIGPNSALVFEVELLEILK